MLTSQKLIHRRIIHIVIIIMTAFFAYQFSNWGDALWIPISVLAIIGPFSPGNSINKAKQRMLGSIGGLLLSVVFWFFLQNFPNSLPVVAVILIYCVGFCLLQKYTFFIMLVSIMLCINFDYMNLFFKNEILFITDRIMCVLTGVMICLFYEYFIFRRSYDNATCLIESERIDSLMRSLIEQSKKYRERSAAICAVELDECINPLIREIERLEQLKGMFTHSYSDQKKSLLLIESYLEKLNSLYEQLTLELYSSLK